MYLAHGSRRGPSGPPRGPDLEAVAPLSFTDAVFEAARHAASATDLMHNMASLARGLLGMGQPGVWLLPVHAGPGGEWSLIYADQPHSGQDGPRTTGFRDIVQALEARLQATAAPA